MTYNRKCRRIVNILTAMTCALSVAACAPISNYPLFKPISAKQAGDIVEQNQDGQPPELQELSKQNRERSRNSDNPVMDAPAREGSGITGEIDMDRALFKSTVSGGKAKGKASAVKLEFENARLKDIITVFMQDYLKKPYTFQDNFKDQQVNLFFDAQATHEDLLELFDSLLANYNVRLRYSGGMYLIGSTEEDKGKINPMKQPSPLGIGDAVGVLRLNFVDVREFQMLAKQVVKEPDRITALPGNVLVINSTSADVRAVRSLLEDVDLPVFSGKHIMVYVPRYLTASSLIAMMDSTQTQLLGPQIGSKQFEAKQIGDTDRIVIVAANKSARDLLVQILAKTDIPGANHRYVFQYMLGVQSAVDIALNIGNLIKSSIKNSNEITITPDKISNSLFIYASPQEYAEIRKLLSSMDYRPPAVQIDMVIAEVTLNDEMRYGVEWYLKRKGTLQADASTLMSIPAAANPNFTFSIINAAGNYATLQLIGSETAFTLLSNPKLVVRNGATASIKVGQKEPVIKQKTAATSTSGSVVEPEFKPIGLFLEVTPTVTANNEVRMIITLKDDSITGYKTLGTDSYPVLANRELKTDLITSDGRTIFLGGIRKQSSTDTTSKIPGLGDMMGLSALFRNKDMTNYGTELIILATPTVMLDQQGADIVTQAVLRASKQKAKEPRVPGELPGETAKIPEAAEQPANTKPKRRSVIREKTQPVVPVELAKQSKQAQVAEVYPPGSVGASLPGAEALNSITALVVSNTGDGKTVLKVELAQPLANLPTGFAVNTPPRIMLDFQNTANSVGKSVQNFSAGDLRSANIVQVGNRTRLVVNLSQMLLYDTRIDGSSVLITLQDKAGAQSISAPAPVAPTPSGMTNAPQAAKPALDTSPPISAESAILGQ